MPRTVNFEISEHNEGAKRTLFLVGELDISVVPLLEQRIGSEPGKEADSVTLDLSDLSFMDSSGLRALILLEQQSGRDGWRLSLIRSTHAAANAVLRLTGADRALPFEDPPRA